MLQQNIGSVLEASLSHVCENTRALTKLKVKEVSDLNLQIIVW